jgi:hypothetical protein
MGKALFYCFKCSRLLREADLEKGQAFRIGDSVACRVCSTSIPGAIPDRPAATPPAVPRPRSSSQRVPVTTGTPRAPLPSARRTSAVPYVVAGGAAFLLVVVVAVSSRPRSASAPAPSPPAPVERPAEIEARGALERARKIERAQLRLAALDDVVWKHPETAAARTAAAERDRLRAELEERLRAAARDLDARIDALLAREQFGDALRLVENAAGTVEAPRWPDELGRRSREIRERAERLYADVREKAVDADALRAAAARIRTWGLRPLTERIERELR